MMFPLAERRIVLVLVLYTCGLAAWLLTNGVRVTLEDGFYYYKVAQHVARGAGSTFDGLNTTNGYHPLWLLSLVPLFWIVSSPQTALAMGITLQGLLMAGAAALIYQTARLRYGRLAAALAALLWILLTYPVSLSGLEFGLHALLLLAAAYLYLRRFAGPRPAQLHTYLLLGILLSLTILARLDTVLFAAILGLWLLYRLFITSDVNTFQLPAIGLNMRLLLALACPILLAGLAYAGFNLLLFGQPLPVSGVIKRSWSAYLLSQDPIYQEYGWLAAKLYHLTWPLRHLNELPSLALAFGTFGAAALWLGGMLSRYIPSPSLSRTHRLNQALKPYRPFIVYSLASFLSYALLYHDSLSFPAWYFVIQPWLAAMLAASFLDYLISRIESSAGNSRLSPLPLLAALILVCAVPLYTIWKVEQWRLSEQRGLSPHPLYDGARWVRENLPPDAVIGAWNAGAIGYLSERQVINLDGLVNSWDFYRTGQHDLCRYWRQMGVTYLVDVFDHRSSPAQAIAPQPTYPYYARCSDQLKLIWSDERYHSSWWRLEAYHIEP